MDEHGSRLARLDARAARRWAVATRAALAANRSEIDALNVFPVPDGDTGTNLYMTLDGALDTFRTQREQLELARAATDLSRAALLAARGNSGVILSQIVRGLSEVIGEAAVTEPDGVDGLILARALRRASDLAYASVTRPVEGTILTVAAAAASAAEEAAQADPDLYAVTSAALGSARAALAGTPDQLPSLAEAGVVDAGGAGYVILIEALERVVLGEGPSDPRPSRRSTPAHPGWRTQGAPGQSRGGDHAGLRHGLDADVAGADVAGAAAAGAASAVRADGEGGDELHGRDGPSYEVMYLLSDSSDDAVAALRTRLDELGDSVLVVGGGDIWNVHAHVDDVGAAIEAGIQAGRPHRIAVTHFGDQQLRQAVREPRVGVSVVACAAGAGLAAVFASAGASVVFGGPGRRASAGTLLDAIRRAGTRCVVVLPNDADTQLAADAAASAAGDEGIQVQVVRSRAAVQGIAALAVFDPEGSLSDNLLAMGAAAAATRHGGVTVAIREAMTSAGTCQPGDVLGVIDDDVVVVGTDPAAVGADVVDRLFGSGGELLTVVVGAGAPADLGEQVAAAARARRRDVEVTVIDGGQSSHILLLGVE